MQMPNAGDAVKQYTPGHFALDRLASRLYGVYSNRHPYVYPDSPYALDGKLGMGDLAPMAAMNPIDVDTLFQPMQLGPTASPYQGVLPLVGGSVLGPAGFTNSSVPAGSLTEAANSGNDTGPITYVQPFPTMVQPPPLPFNTTPQSFMCELGTWVNANPAAALLGVGALYAVLKSRKGKR